MDQTQSLIKAGEIWKSAWAMYKTKFYSFLEIMAVPAILAGVLKFMSEVRGEEDGAAALALFTFVPYVVLFILYILVASIAELALIYSVKNLLAGVTVSARDAFKLAWQNLFSYWWILILMTLVTVGGFILLIIPGIILAVRYAFSINALADQGLKGWAALSYSKEQVTGRWSAVFGKLAYLGLIIFLISIAIGIVFAFFGTPGKSLADVLGKIIVTPLTWLYVFLLYNNLKQTKTGEPTS
jgi:hypothetical protein